MIFLRGSIKVGEGKWRQRLDGMKCETIYNAISQLPKIDKNTSRRFDLRAFVTRVRPLGQNVEKYFCLFKAVVIPHWMQSCLKTLPRCSLVRLERIYNATYNVYRKNMKHFKEKRVWILILALVGRLDSTIYQIVIFSTGVKMLQKQLNCRYWANSK